MSEDGNNDFFDAVKALSKIADPKTREELAAIMLKRASKNSGKCLSISI